MYAGRTLKFGLERLHPCLVKGVLGATAPAASDAAGRLLAVVGSGSQSVGFNQHQPKRAESTVTAFDFDDSVLPGDYNDHEEWYEQTRTKPIVSSYEEGQRLNAGKVTMMLRSAAVAASAKRFEEMPGPRGLPVIGNVLSYSRLGTCAHY
jgi:hypothetical protein